VMKDETTKDETTILFRSYPDDREQHEDVS
jgi:hypothetical protein